MEQESAEVFAPPPPPGFKQRVGSLPIVMSAVGKLGEIYGNTKQYNQLLKYGLETAEVGLMKGTALATPVYNRFGRPVNALDLFAVSQLDKLEERLPIMTKSSDQVIDEGWRVYNDTIGPTVNRLSSVAKYGSDTVSSVKERGSKTINGIWEFAIKRKDGAMYYVRQTKDQLTVKYEGVTYVGRDALARMIEVNKKRAMGALEYGGEKVVLLLDSYYGQKVTEQVDGIIDRTDGLLDYYVPEQIAEEGKPAGEGEPEGVAADCPPPEGQAQEPQEPQEEQEAPEGDQAEEKRVQARETLTKGYQLSRKVSGRLMNRTKAGCNGIMARTQEAIGKLSYTVDLMEYARTQMDNAKSTVQGGLVRSKDKLWSTWEILNEDPEANNENRANESVLISNARRLTHRVKRTLDALPSPNRYMPDTFRTTLTAAQDQANQLYQTFRNAPNNLSNIPSATLTRARTLIASLQGTTTDLFNYMKGFVPFMGDPNKSLTSGDDETGKQGKDQLDETDKPLMTSSPEKQGRGYLAETDTPFVTSSLNSSDSPPRASTSSAEKPESKESEEYHTARTSPVSPPTSPSKGAKPHSPENGSPYVSPNRSPNRSPEGSPDSPGEDTQGDQAQQD